MTVANPREVPEYELNPVELQVRKSDGISKVCFSFFHLVTFDLVIQQLWLFWLIRQLGFHLDMVFVLFMEIKAC